jgi:RNAse (barnase) inhibitor barstar
MIVVEIDALVIHCSTVNELIWVHQEFPWIGYGFIHLVHESAGSIVRTSLRELGFTEFDLQGSQMTDDRSLHEELAREFGFPDYYGHNWDGFNDSWAEIEPALPSPAATLWHEADSTAAAALKPYSEAVVLVRDVASAECDIVAGRYSS